MPVLSFLEARLIESVKNVTLLGPNLDSLDRASTTRISQNLRLRLKLERKKGLRFRNQLQALANMTSKDLLEKVVQVKRWVTDVILLLRLNMTSLYQDLEHMTVH